MPCHQNPKSCHEFTLLSLFLWGGLRQIRSDPIFCALENPSSHRLSFVRWLMWLSRTLLLESKKAPPQSSHVLILLGRSQNRKPIKKIFSGWLLPLLPRVFLQAGRKTSGATEITQVLPPSPLQPEKLSIKLDSQTSLKGGKNFVRCFLERSWQEFSFLMRSDSGKALDSKTLAFVIAKWMGKLCGDRRGGGTFPEKTLSKQLERTKERNSRDWSDGQLFEMGGQKW